MHDRSLARTGVAAGVSITAAMAAMALYNVCRARQSERRYRPRGRFVNVNGVRLHYLEAGSGPPVILLHGNVVDAEDFELSGMLPSLARHYRVLAFDRPGFGYSDRPYGAMWSPTAQSDLLRAAWTRLGIDHPVVLGHSWGAMVALATALNHGSSLAGLVLLSGYYYSSLRADALLSAPAAIPVIGDLLRFTVSPLLGQAMLPRLFAKMFAPRAVPEAFADRFLGGLPVRPSQIRAASQDGVSMIPAASAMRSRYEQLRLPVIIMAGAGDEVIRPASQAVRLHNEIAHSRLQLVPNAGHMLHYAAAADVLHAVHAALLPRGVI